MLIFASKYIIRRHQTNGTGNVADDFTYEV